MSEQLVTEEIHSADPPSPAASTHEILQRAEEFFRAHHPDCSAPAIAAKIENLRAYDVLRMDRIAAILPWGRSGSVLLASYLDSHEDVLTLPKSAGGGCTNVQPQLEPVRCYCHR